MEWNGGGGGQNGVGLQNPKRGMILFLFQGCYFACLPFEFETEFDVGALSKVVVLDEILEEVQRLEKV